MEEDDATDSWEESVRYVSLVYTRKRLPGSLYVLKCLHGGYRVASMQPSCLKPDENLIVV